jgi:DNA-binding CsgD family transcriptional regulator
VVERCKALVADADADAADEHFDAALQLHDQLATPFERARTELCFGEALRRSKRRREARVQLGQALDTFGRLDARPWIARAQHELAATGLSARSRDPEAAAELTPQELRVALTVAQGASNREAAEALFLSTKTIEYHLGSVYRKLNLRSRIDLARFYASQRSD